MDSPRPAVDLENELTCAICTDLLYQPLTLLDCLHTFCGACLKDWFGWQAAAAEGAPTPPAPDSPVFTCPSCRAPVRDTKHDAKVATLLDMFLSVNPSKAKPEDEMAEMNRKYKRGDKVLRRLKIPHRTPEQLRLDEEERRLIEQVRSVSLQEAFSAAEAQQRSRRRGDEARTVATTTNGAGAGREPRSSRASAVATVRSREPSTESGHSAAGRARDARTRERTSRQVTEAENRIRAEQTIMLQPATRHGDARRPRSSESQHRRSGESTHSRRRPIEHQSSIRSLISTDSGSLDIDREIEEFARQIQEEGLLDGLDLENIDLTNNDELSRRITEAYRRRQRERSTRTHTGRRSDASRSSGARQSRTQTVEPSSRPRRRSLSLSTPQSPSNTHNRSHSATSQSEERSIPPVTNAAHLDAHGDSRRRRQSTSRTRSSTTPLPSTAGHAQAQQSPRQHHQRAAARSQTDISHSRPSVMDSRSSSSPTMLTGTGQVEKMNSVLPFSARVIGTPPSVTIPSFESNVDRGRRTGRPSDIGVSPVLDHLASDSPLTLSPNPNSQKVRKHKQVYQEPALSCSACEKQHIEYEVHYNCNICDEGSYTLCLNCYRKGKGCYHWFGFGTFGINKWERVRETEGDSFPEPHVLTASRYLAPEASISENPADRLQEGAFCSRCLAWANDCYWKCGTCNGGDWGFCNECVNQGRSCPHLLIAVSQTPQARNGFQSNSRPHSASSASAQTPIPTPPVSPIASSSLRPGGHTRRTSSVSSGGPLSRWLDLKTLCDACRCEIPPVQNRYHCYYCTSSIVTNSRPGDYNICESCYVGDRRQAVSPENGADGWRRCPKAGHRMVVVGFREAKLGRWYRITLQDLVGGRKLRVIPVDGFPALQRWTWVDDGGKTMERLVSVDARQCATTVRDGPGGEGLPAVAVAAAETDVFPPDGGTGLRRQARWAWYPDPETRDELMFPKGAEICEITAENPVWSSGTCMGERGFFPINHMYQPDVDPVS